MTDARLAAGEESDASATKVYCQIVSLMNQLLRQLGLIAQLPTPIPRRRHGREPATLEEYQAALEGGEIDPDPVKGLTPGDDRETDGGRPMGLFDDALRDDDDPQVDFEPRHKSLGPKPHPRRNAMKRVLVHLEDG